MTTSTLAADRGTAPLLPAIPFIDVGQGFPLETLERDEKRAHALLDAATRHVPRAALKSLDAVSRRWLLKGEPRHLAEVDRIATKLARPGAYFLSINYEWGCTCRVAPPESRASARLIRVLDWATHGLGRYLVAARVAGAAGPFVTLTWPGYTGVLQANAPGRFAAALNQAPMRKTVGWLPADWAVNRARVWRMPYTTASHLLREVFERARSFDEAKRLLTERPIAAPAIFSLAGTKASELAVIERREVSAAVHECPQVAANHWQAPGWQGRARGVDSAGRASLMACVAVEFDAGFPWLVPPILNPRTRLVMLADAASGRLMVQGYEDGAAATEVLDVVA
jgi:hypothetical protein